jgi:hypothetical protein
MLTLADDALASSVCYLKDRVPYDGATRPDVNPLYGFLTPLG